MRIEDFFREGMLKKSRIDNKEIEGSIELSKRFLERTKGNLMIKYPDVAFILAYNSMFHCARALLFSEGIKERSHFAMIAYLRERFKGDEKLSYFLNILDSYRIARHCIQYRGDLCSEIDAEEAIKDASEFLKIVQEYFKKAKLFKPKP